MLLTRACAVAVGIFTVLHAARAESLISDDTPLSLPPPGAHELRILSPDFLELTLITTKKPAPAPVEQWNFTDAAGHARLPAADSFLVLVDGWTNAVKSIGFKRRVVYAPLKERDLRI